MEPGIQKCGALALKRGKVVSSEGVEMPERERIKEVLRRTKLIMKSRLNCRSKIIAINTWAGSLMRYGAGVVKWTKLELDEIDRKTRKVMTLNKELHLRSYANRLYVSRMEGGKRLIGCKMCVKAEENSFG